VPAVLAEDAEIESQKPATLNQPDSQAKQISNARAVGGKGVVIVGQDGINVKFRKKCTDCAYEDTCWHTLPIKAGSTRVSFFCPKCRRKRDGEIHGYAN